ncbi:MAG TPA: hypothetical protein VEZ48_04450 [Sphingomonadaceae bacterium]|nr:hypothetical protein [Sphingomonadaceae bacterium]
MNEAPLNDLKSAAAQAARSEFAFALKQAGASDPAHPETGEHADPGVKSIPRDDLPPSGAFDAEGHRPVLERSRKVR